jgi:hypothetical protein
MEPGVLGEAGPQRSLEVQFPEAQLASVSQYSSSFA